MLRSLYSAVSGVKAHQTYLDVTGNNVANVNTVGFKKDSVLFADQIYQTQKSASAPNNGIPIGGINPAQVGLGVQVAAIETIHSQGSSQNTGQETDMMINGKGFFVTEMGGQRYYTRSGAFSLDRDYNLVQQGTGYLVQGYAYKNQIDPSTGRVTRVKDTNLSNIRIPIGDKLPAKPTELVNFRCNLCQSVKGEIEDYESIPGGTEIVPRPHDYTAYGSPVEVAQIGGTALTDNGKLTFVPPAAGVPLGTLTIGDGVAAQGRVADATTIYVGEHATPPTGYTTSYSTGDGQYQGAAVARATVDQTATTTPTNPAAGPVPPISKAGETCLVTAGADAGKIFTANATGTAWILTSSTTVNRNTAYGVVGSDHVWSRALNTGDMTDIFGTSPTIYDTDKKNLYTWKNGEWVNVNADMPSDRNLSPSTDSKTTQATIDAFQDSIVANNDHTIKLTVYDSLGTPRTMEIFFRKVVSTPSYPNGKPGATVDTPIAAETQWDWYSCFLNEDGSVAVQYGEGAGTLVFGDDGLLKRTYYFDPTPATPDPAATPTSQPVYNWEIKEFIVGKDEGSPTGVMIADFGIEGAEGSVVDGVPVTYESNKITLDFLGYDYADMLGMPFDTTGLDGVTQFASPTTTVARYQDGYAMGVLNNFSVGSDGTITGQYSNGQNLPIAQVAVAMFANDAGLTKVGGTYFQESANSGMAQIGGGMSNGAGSIMSNNLEMSNVDLSEEFVNLIKAQRGLQANSRVVTTSDQVLEELINLKR